MRALLIAGFILCGTAIAASAQTAAPAQDAADPVEGRIARARALAAAHRLASAAGELDIIRTTAVDESVRDVARIMLMNIYLEEGDYTRADALLVDTFKARSAAQESTVQSYFALAGQTINGARHHLDRYREFGINVADKNLPQEAQSDLDHLRQLLERISTQATQISNEDNKRTDAVALLEEVAGVRAAVARDDDDRQLWQQQFEAARQKLAASETRIASISPLVPARPGPSNVQGGAGVPAGNSGAASSSSPASGSRRNSAANRAAAAPKNSGESRSVPASSSASTTAAAAAQPAPAEPAPASEKRAAGGASAGQPVDVGSLIEKAAQKVNPIYPAAAKNVRIAGVVTVYLLVDENGSVEAVQRISGPALLRQAASDAAKRWKFRPTMVDGQPVRVAGYINFNFTM